VRVELAQGGRVVVHGRTDGLGALTGENLIINGDFRVNQRDFVSGNYTAASEYSFDRWRDEAGTTTMTFPSGPNGRTVTFSGSENKMIGQFIERESVPAGTYVLSWEGTAEGVVANVSGDLSGQATSPVVVTLDGTDDVSVRMKVATGTSATVTKVKLERGTVPTPFVPRLYGEELALCQRYYWRTRSTQGSSFPFGTGAWYNSSNFYMAIQHPTTMRGVPVFSRSSALAGFGVYGPGGNKPPTGVSMTLINDITALIRFDTPTVTAGTAGVVQSIGSETWMAFDAEL